MKKISIVKSLALVVTSTLVLTSCDKDFNEIGSDIIGDNNFLYELYDEATVTAYNQPLGAVQSNNQAINSLGIYNNPAFGATKSSFVTQVQLAYANPKFNADLLISVDSVAVIVPYFNRLIKTNEDGTREYALDSLYGSNSINLKIYENGYKLNDLSASDNFTTSQKYYSNQFAEIEGNKLGSNSNNSPTANGEPLNNSNLTNQNTSFVFSNKGISYPKRDNLLNFVVPAQGSEKEYDSIVAPRMSINLNKEYFAKKIFEAPSGALFNQESFKDYFRGLYFKVENAENGSLAQLDFASGYIAIYYSEYESKDTEGNPSTFDHDNNMDTPEVPKKVFRRLYIKLKGNTVNLLENINTNTEFQTAMNNRDIQNGDSRLYIKGGHGSMALIDLFKGDELQTLIDDKWMINEANLTFHIDKSKMSNSAEPQRIFLYDATHNQVIQDYTLDATTFGNGKSNKYVYDGILQKETGENAKGEKYRIRITNHIRNLVRRDSTNVRLGLVITEDITTNAFSKLKNNENGPFPPSENPFTLDRIPRAAVMSPLGTILYGSNIPENDENYAKRLKLEIYYTKPN